MSVPVYLDRLLREGTRDVSLVRRCQRHLLEIWTGLVEYTGSKLDSRMQWDDTIRPQILQRWYTPRRSPAQHGRPAGRVVVQDQGRPTTAVGPLHAQPPLQHAGSPQQSGHIHRGLSWVPVSSIKKIHVTQPEHSPVSSPAQCHEQGAAAIQEGLVKQAGPLSEREQYCLRKLVVSYPIFDLITLRTLSATELAWWTRERKSLVVPCRENPWFDTTLRTVLDTLRGDAPPDRPLRVPPRPLLYQAHEGVDTKRIPHNVAIFCTGLGELCHEMGKTYRVGA